MLSSSHSSSHRLFNHNRDKIQDERELRNRGFEVSTDALFILGNQFSSFLVELKFRGAFGNSVCHAA